MSTLTRARLAPERQRVRLTSGNPPACLLIARGWGFWRARAQATTRTSSLAGRQVAAAVPMNMDGGGEEEVEEAGGAEETAEAADTMEGGGEEESEEAGGEKEAVEATDAMEGGGEEEAEEAGGEKEAVEATDAVSSCC